MAERRSLVDGLKATPAVDPEVERQFVFRKPAPPTQTPVPASPASKSNATSRVPISSRMRTDFAQALKRASLQRQLEGVEPNSLTDILEAAIEPWLRSNGYLE